MRKITVTTLIFLLLITSSAMAKTFPPQTNVPVDKVWTVKFNKSVDASSITPNSVSLSDNAGQKIAYTSQIEDNNLLVDATPDYDPGKTYTLSINGVTSSGQALKESVSITFTTKQVDLPPATPTGLAITSQQGQYTITWDLNTESDVIGYLLKYAPSSSGPWKYAVNGLNESLLTSPILIMKDVPNGTTNYFYLIAVDRALNESEPTETRSATTPSAGYAIIPPMTLWSDDGTNTYLGKVVSNQYDVESIFNAYGLYGSSYSITSVMNQYSIYGSSYSIYSAFNQFASKPPIIKDANGTIVGRLTTNTFISGAVSPNGLQQSLQNMGY